MFVFNWKVHNIYAVLENTHKNAKPTKQKPTDQPTKADRGDCVVEPQKRQNPNQTGEKREMEMEKQRSEEKARTSKLQTEKHKYLYFFSGIITHFLLIEPKKNPTIFPHCFFCLKSNFCSITNCAYGPFTWQVCKEPNGLSWYTLLAENINIKHCVCPGTALNKETELLLRRPPKC